MTPTPEIRVRTTIRHPRLRYVLQLLGDDLGYRFLFENDRSVFPTAPPRYRIGYGGEGPHALPHHPLLVGRAPAPVDLAPTLRPDGLPTFFATPRGPDLLACIFFAVSRYEEYQPFTPDRHGRFTAAQSHAGRHGYLHRPVVREWSALLGQQLREWFPDLPPPRERELELRPTYDIDLLWAWHHRGWRGMAGGLRDLLRGQWQRAVSRWRSLPENDPYNTIGQLEDLHRRLGLTATYFWLVARPGCRQDTNPFPIPATQRAVMQELESSARQGLHPGYRSSEHPELLAKEKQLIAELLEREVESSRQHFLRLRLPHTYRQLEEHGLREDHSMGYSDDVGWRAGTNLPFPWYDLERERATRLIIHPFAAMDVTLKQYLGLSGADAGARIRDLARHLLPYGGPFPLLWHNSSFAAAYGWEDGWDHYATTLTELLADGAVPWRPD
ncbi:hypothetical protein GGR26_001497 [Lewinella marina]|uniref:DUF7033 domain-containing protein n=1 Tax=Neolewinella marina TaxID=438751 RepID=A0A2G0CF19_9BACT|nr:polysaccharide deacetylase family protein [Neolewinella marina]NJB85752.1 hypothetical protein [Neolewinella marina]PHK98574.1 hypothetical protein CGL56_08860 [Neolewinella marina]